MSSNILGYVSCMLWAKYRDIFTANYSGEIELMTKIRLASVAWVKIFKFAFKIF